MRKYINAEVLRNDILEHKRKMPPGYERHNAMVQALAVIDRQPAVQLANVNDIIQDLREYAEKKFQNGEIDMAHGILKAVCKIEQTIDENE